MCRGGSPPPPLPPPSPAPSRPQPTAKRVVTSGQRRINETDGGRRTNRLGRLRRLGTQSLRIPLMNTNDLNYPL